MRKSDFSAIAHGLAKFDKENKTNTSKAIYDIFDALYPDEVKRNEQYPRLLEMFDEYELETNRLYDADKSPLQLARESHEKEALNQ